AATLGIDPKNYSDSELRRVVREWEDADRGEQEVRSRRSETEEESFVAYHGSPEQFDKFDFSKVGSNNGAAFFGHGINLAGDAAVAEKYAGRRGKGIFPTEREKSETGHVYEVEINRPERSFLDWDKPLEQQDASVVAALDKTGLVQADEWSKPAGDWFKSLTNPRYGDTSPEPLAKELAEAGIPGVRHVGAAGPEDRGYVVFDPTAIKRVRRRGAEASAIVKTPEGAYAATAKDGEPLGVYTSKRKAEEAVADKRQTNDAVEGMALRRAAEVEATAKAYSEKLPPGKPPKDIDRQTEMLDFRPQPKMRMKDLAVPEAKITFPRTLAMHDRPFAKLFKPVEKREEAQTRNYRDFFWQMKPVGALTKPSRDQVYKAAVLARLQGRNIVPSGGRLVIKNGDQAVINPDTGKPFVGAGETIKLSKEETEAFFALKATMQNVWRRYGDAVVRNAGYDGDLAELRKAARSPEAAKKFLEASSKPETAQTALDLMMAMQDQERAGYIPFQRRGDVMITVMPKATKEMKLSAGDLGGKLEPLHVEFVDTDTLGKQIKGRRFTEGDYTKAVTQRVKELKARFKDTGDVMEPRYISEVGAEELSIPALEKLVSGLANKNPELRNTLYNEFLNQVKDKRKAGFRQKSANVPGFSTDFDRMVTEYLHHTARVLPMIEYRNEVGKARQRLIEGETDSKGKKSAPEGSPSVRRFAEKWLQSVDDPGGDFAGLRKAGFLWWLWASPASAAVNLTQTPLVTIPVIGKWGGMARAMLETNRIATQILRPDKMMFSKKNWGTENGKIVLNIDNLRLPEKEKALLKEWERDGTLQAQVTSDMLGLNIGKSPAFRPMAKMAQKAYEAGASLFGAAEVTNRAIAGLTAYRLALQPAALEKAKKVYKDNQLFQEQFGDKVTPENLAKWAILETQFQGGKINAPEITRGIGAPLTQFKKFTGNYISLLNRQLRHEGAAGKTASAMMLGALVMAAGLKGLPFAQDLADAADWATEFATGINPHIEMTIRNWLRDGLEGAGG
ncbi:MAG: PLxRFG domain-containing protein, partial [Planctomycetes bacterium]|nr:PLxRFG domain-containing protein [Planctomycetota bacterium]